MTGSKILSVALLLVTLIALASVSDAQFQGTQGTPGVRGQPRTEVPASVPTVSNVPPPLETDMVLLTVSVTGPGNKPVPALPRERLHIFEDGVEQKVTYFWVDSRPISVGLLVDDSGFMSVNHKSEDLRDVLPTFLKNKNAEDEYFVLQFSTFPRMTVSYTTDAKLAPTILGGTGSDSSTPDTALLDAIYLGLESIKESANSRKALLVITAGGDKGCDGTKINQTMKPDQLLSFAIKQGVQIYSMMIADDWGTANAGMPCEQLPKDSSSLEELASNTGGNAYLSPNSQGGVDSIAAEIAMALKTQYLVGYKSTNTARDGKRRGVKVKVDSQEGSPKLKAWTRSGYYAPKEKQTRTGN